MTDREWVERARKGDNEARRKVVELYYPSVLRFLSTLCGPDDAQELAQETFVKALGKFKTFRGESRLRTWLHSIAYREYTNHRRRKPTLQISDDHPSRLFEPSTLLALDLERAMQKLTPDLRAAFVLCDVLELTDHHAASVLDVPVGTVKSRLHAARQRLQSLLEPSPEVKENVARIS